MDAVKAIQWNGDNFEAVQKFLEPSKLTLILRGDRLLLIDTVDKVHWIRLSDWLTTPGHVIGTYEVVDTRKDYDEAGSKGFKSDKLCIVSMGRVKSEFLVELDESDNVECPVCHKLTFEHKLLVGDKLEYVCPPDPANEIDAEFATGEILPVDSEDMLSPVGAWEFKKGVLARALGPVGIEAAFEPEGLTFVELDKHLEKLIGEPEENDGSDEAEIPLPELDEDEMDSSLLNAQNSWRK
jgi:hypothetical protein